MCMKLGRREFLRLGVLSAPFFLGACSNEPQSSNQAAEIVGNYPYIEAIRAKFGIEIESEDSSELHYEASGTLTQERLEQLATVIFVELSKYPVEMLAYISKINVIYELKVLSKNVDPNSIWKCTTKV